MKILYVISEPTLVDNVLSIATETRKKYPDCENVILDPRNMLQPECSTRPLAAELTLSEVSIETVNRKDFADILDGAFHIMAYEFYRRIYERIKPSIVVVMHEYGYAFYAVQAAILFGIPSYHLQHGMYEAGRFKLEPTAKNRQKTIIRSVKKVLSYPLRKTLAGLRTLKKNQNVAESQIPDTLVPFEDKLKRLEKDRYPLYADKIGLWGERYKQQLKCNREGFLENRIDVVGCLHGDFFIKNAVVSQKELYAELGFDPSGRVAVYIYCPFHEIPGYKISENPERALLDTVSALRSVDSGINILVLTHPNYNVEKQLNRLRQELKGYERIAVREGSSNFFSLCRISSVIVSVKSTLLYLAMMVKIPIVVQLYVLSENVDTQHVEAGAVIPCFSKNTLLQKITMALKDESLHEELYKNQNGLCGDLMGPLDGMSSVRTASAILEHAKEKV